MQTKKVRTINVQNFVFGMLIKYTKKISNIIIEHQSGIQIIQTSKISHDTAMEGILRHDQETSCVLIKELRTRMATI